MSVREAKEFFRKEVGKEWNRKYEETQGSYDESRKNLKENSDMENETGFS